MTLFAFLGVHEFKPMVGQPGNLRTVFVKFGFAQNGIVATSIEVDDYRPHLEQITDYGANKIRQVKTLMGRHEDIPLTKLDYEEVERMLRFWRQRPPQKDSEDRISVKSASNYVGELRRFFAWLHRSNRYPWRKPEDFDDIDVTVNRDHAGEQRRLAHTPVFTLDELILLNRYATPP